MHLEAASGVDIDENHVYAYKLKIIDDRYYVQVLVMTPTDFTGHGEWVTLKGNYNTFSECAKFTQELKVPLR